MRDALEEDAGLYDHDTHCEIIMCADVCDWCDGFFFFSLCRSHKASPTCGGGFKDHSWVVMKQVNE